MLDPAIGEEKGSTGMHLEKTRGNSRTRPVRVRYRSGGETSNDPFRMYVQKKDQLLPKSRCSCRFDFVLPSTLPDRKTLLTGSLHTWRARFDCSKDRMHVDAGGSIWAPEVQLEYHLPPDTRGNSGFAASTGWCV